MPLHLNVRDRDLLLITEGLIPDTEPDKMRMIIAQDLSCSPTGYYLFTINTLNSKILSFMQYFSPTIFREVCIFGCA